MAQDVFADAVLAALFCRCCPAFLPQNVKTMAVAVAFSMAWREDVVQDGDRGCGLLTAFRGALRRCFAKRPDALFELADMAPRHACHVAWACAGPAAFLIVTNRDHGPAPVRRRGDTPQPARSQPARASSSAANPKESDVRARDHSPGRAEGFDGTIRLAGQQLPAARQMPGFTGYYLLTDTETSKLVIISLWETREQMDAVTAGAGASGIRDQHIPATGLTALHLETYEVTMHA